jgi:hypothetical protein
MAVIIADTYVWQHYFSNRYDFTKLGNNRFAATLINIQELVISPRNRRHMNCVMSKAILYTWQKMPLWGLPFRTFKALLPLLRFLGFTPPPKWIWAIYHWSQPRMHEGILIGSDPLSELARDIVPGLPLEPFLNHEFDWIGVSEFLASKCSKNSATDDDMEARSLVVARFGRILRDRQARAISDRLQYLFDNHLWNPNRDFRQFIPTVTYDLNQYVQRYERVYIRSGLQHSMTYQWPRRQLLIHMGAILYHRYLTGGWGNQRLYQQGVIRLKPTDAYDLLNYAYHQPGYLYLVDDNSWIGAANQLIDNFPQLGTSIVFRSSIHPNF